MVPDGVTANELAEFRVRLLLLAEVTEQLALALEILRRRQAVLSAEFHISRSAVEHGVLPNWGACRNTVISRV